MSKTLDIESFVGQKFNRLKVKKILSPVVIKDDRGYIKETRHMVECECLCGIKKFNVMLKSIRSGNTKSCGCLNLESASRRTTERNTTHGLSKIPEYKVWLVLKDRCRNPKNKNYQRYGGRGIDFCKEWDSFEQFINDMGNRPKGKLTIERIDNDRGYSKENCRWATYKEQAQNTTRSRLFDYEGSFITSSQLSDLTGLDAKALYHQIFKNKLTAKEAIEIVTKNRRWKK